MTTGVVDPIRTEIIRNAFMSIAEQMNRTLIRTAHSPVIYEMRDCSVGLFDRFGRLLGQSTGLPIFLGNLDVAVRVVRDRFGEDIRRGDAFLVNDSYLVGTHLSDMTLIAPIFVDRDLIGFSVSRAHWRDIGGRDPGGVGTVEIYQEGLRLGPVRIVSEGKVNDDLVDILRRNSRTPDMIIGDLFAQLSAATVGGRGLAELVAKYPIPVIDVAAAEIFEQSAEIDRACVHAIPDGVYKASGFLDNDGVGSEPVNVSVSVSVSGSEMHIDLTGSSPTVAGFVNCGYAQAVSGCRVAFKTIVNPEAAVTGGSFAPLRITVPEDSVFNAKEPAACQFYFSPLGLLIDLVAKALAPALPNKVAAAHFGDSMVVNFVRRRATSSGPFFVMAEALAGGWGASAKQDGESAQINNVNGGFRNLPVEVAESKFPIRLLESRIRHGSGGIGRRRGGCGIVRTYEVLEGDVCVTLHLERSSTPAWGLFGGMSAEGPYAELSLDAGATWTRLPNKTSLRPIPAGGRVRVATGGGGGFGRAEGV